ncbi:uncharacterized WD repeat-containing protein-like protein isoform X1, partial [Tanacetum coccineum]
DKLINVLGDNGWKWTQQWFIKYPWIVNIQVPILSNHQDKAIWVDNNGREKRFTTNIVWKDVRVSSGKVSWCDLIWHPNCIPKHTFILWLGVKEKLYTQDRMGKWYPNKRFECSLCNKEPDSHEHLFFKCKYAQYIWKKICDMAKLRKLCLAVSVYFIWQERNKRLFNSCRRDEEDLFKTICEELRAKMVSITVKSNVNIIQAETDNMAQLHNQQLEYIIDDEYYNMNEFADHSSATFAADPMDSDFEDDIDQSKPITDTSAEEARNGKDIQGIPWERLNFTREKYRETRLLQYKNYQNLDNSHDDLEKECKIVDKGHTFYDFQFNTRLVKPTVVHFQLRNLLWATSKHDLYLMQNYSVMHWSSLLKRGKEVINVAMPVLPTLKYPGSFSRSLSRVQVSTMAVKDELIVAGGFHGELICKYLNKPGVSFATKIATDETAITNSVDISYSSSGAMRVMTANNDALIRVFDAKSFTCVDNFSFPWCVNDTSVSPDGKLLAVLGDSTECLIADAQSGKEINKMKGHVDYSFASAWHPNGQIVATGNQDTTCRLWDIRNPSKSLAVLKGRMGAIRAIRFSSDGRYLAIAEPADFVHIFDSQTDYGS